MQTRTKRRINGNGREREGKIRGLTYSAKASLHSWTMESQTFKKRGLIEQRSSIKRWSSTSAQGGGVVRTFSASTPSGEIINLSMRLLIVGISLRYFQHAYSIPIVGGMGKEKRTLTGPWWCKGSTRYWNYLEGYWPSAGALSAVNANGTQLRDPINSGLT